MQSFVNLIVEEGKIIVEYQCQPVPEDQIDAQISQLVEKASNPEQAAEVLSRIILNMAYYDIKDIAELVNSINGINLKIEEGQNKIRFIIEFQKDEKLEKLAKLLAIAIASFPQWINARFQSEAQELLDKNTGNES
ncbi:MAG: hypothetical protein GXO42_02110 [bacterium]|nr:hypothetical protein [bacterium]